MLGRNLGLLKYIAASPGGPALIHKRNNFNCNASHWAGMWYVIWGMWYVDIVVAD
jgi:hypothetical protein